MSTQVFFLRSSNQRQRRNRVRPHFFVRSLGRSMFCGLESMKLIVADCLASFLIMYHALCRRIAGFPRCTSTPDSVHAPVGDDEDCGWMVLVILQTLGAIIGLIG